MSFAYAQNNVVGLYGDKLGWVNVVDLKKKFYQLTVNEKYDQIILDLSKVRLIYPNGVVPLIAEMDRLKNTRGTVIQVIPPKDRETTGYAERLGWLHYLDPEKYDFPHGNRYQNFALHSFRNDEELNEVINGAIGVCLQQLVFADGVPQAFEWALNEIAGNILVHAGVKVGWLQVLINKDRHMMSIIVCDSGVGIPHNMKKVFPEIESDRFLIEHSIKKGITSNPANGQGNGLAGTVAIAQASESSLSIYSGKGTVYVNGGRIKSQRHFPPTYGTMVDLQFNTEKPIDLPKALWGHNPINIFETMYEDEKGDLVFNLHDYASNFGNRPTGERIRNLVINLMKQNPGFAVSINMSEVGVLSSSFADELFGKLAVKFGILDFSRFVKLIQVNPLCKNIIDVAINQRIAQSFDPGQITMVKDFS
ncbi:MULTISPECIES: DUF4325 domain-containing protein [unclassified Dehalobacter]|jgi:Histidine kinase-, DNA gyrase B-, and HSP90-like ATPase.|uniref:STAS-like domain-containing protein n=1 Tax=unclassified Dehalobacter TaxID=2635733 RepID=UPI00028A7D02|nr:MULTISPECIES: DUF4325 domain-containing protein [unclassified Dehalobacter]AFV02810.1 hypothetical protein DHBDCA_p1784 [Dehalobacter sp. DCA]AFV05795.1 hypothetical protein DCF50_p1793 [Dehalobacter sp. CF]